MACLFDEIEKITGPLENSDSKYDNSDAEVLQGLMSSIGDFKSKVAGYKATDGQKAVIHSGGALGADHAFGALGSNYGVDTNHYYYGESGKPTYGTHPITQLEYVQGMIMVNKAAKLLNKTPGSVMPLLARNWMQVRNADVVVAVSSFELDSKGNNTSKVEGGTGWAVAMAEIVDKPVLVYNMPDGLWYESSTDSATGKRVFTAVKGTPKLPEGAKDIAGIGTRGVEYEYGRGAEGAAIEKRSAAFGAIEEFIATNFGDKIGDDTTIMVLADNKEKKVDKYGERDTVYISEVPGLKTYSSEETGLSMDSADDRGVIERMFNIDKLSDTMRMFLSDIKGKAVMYTDSNKAHSWLYRLVQDTANSSAITATVVSDHMKSMLKIFSEITYENNIVWGGKGNPYHRVNEDGSLSELNVEDAKKVSKGIYAMQGNRPAEGFGNPFVTKASLVKGDDTIFVGSNDKASYEYFMWLTDYKYEYPKGTSEATEAVLDKRKQWVRKNAKLKELAEDTVDIYIQYSGIGRGESVNHIKALIAAARVLVRGKDYSKADKNVVSTPIAVDSNQTGLEAALTNPTDLAKKKGNLDNDYPIEYEGKTYVDVEEAFQKNKSTDEANTKPSMENSGNYKLMVDLIKIKFMKYPRLVSSVTKKGGIDYLNRIVHQPTKKNSVWETGGQDWFKKALIEAYGKAQEVDIDNDIDVDMNSKVDEYVSELPSASELYKIDKHGHIVEFPFVGKLGSSDIFVLHTTNMTIRPPINTSITTTYELTTLSITGFDKLKKVQDKIGEKLANVMQDQYTSASYKEEQKKNLLDSVSEELLEAVQINDLYKRARTGKFDLMFTNYLYDKVSNFIRTGSFIQAFNAMYEITRYTSDSVQAQERRAKLEEKYRLAGIDSKTSTKLTIEQLDIIFNKVPSKVTKDVGSGRTVTITMNAFDVDKTKAGIVDIFDDAEMTGTTKSNFNGNTKLHKAVAFGPVNYAYSGGRILHKASPMDTYPILTELAAIAEKDSGVEAGYYNHVLISWFSTDKGIGGVNRNEHTDAEDIYVDRSSKDAVGKVAIFSIGDTKGNHTFNKVEAKAESGSLVTMSTGRIPHYVAPAADAEGRYSVTFRHIPKANLPVKEELIDIGAVNERISWADFIKNFYLPSKGAKSIKHTDAGGFDANGNYNKFSTEIQKEERRDGFIKSKTRSEKNAVPEDDFSTEIRSKFAEFVREYNGGKAYFDNTIFKVLYKGVTGKAAQEVRSVLMKAAEATMEAIESSGNPDWVGAFDKQVEDEFLFNKVAEGDVVTGEETTEGTSHYDTLKGIVKNVVSNKGTYVPAGHQVVDNTSLWFLKGIQGMALDGTLEESLAESYLDHKGVDLNKYTAKERMTFAKKELDDVAKKRKEELIEVFGESSIDFMALDASYFYSRYYEGSKTGEGRSKGTEGLSDAIMSGDYSGKGGFKNLLKYVIENSEDTDAVAYAKAALEIANKYKGNELLRVNTNVDASSEGGGTLAYYSPRTNSITYTSVNSMGNPFTLIHEIMHGLSYNAIRSMQDKIATDSDASESKIYSNLFNDIDFVLTKVADDLDRTNVYGIAGLYGRDSGGSFYGLTNRDEFLAEFMSNSYFREFLKHVYPKGTRLSLYSKVILALSKLLGIQSSKTASMFDIIDSKMHVIFEANNGNSEASLDGSTAKLKEATKERSSIISNTKDRDGQALSDVEAAIRMSEENKEKGIRC